MTTELSFKPIKRNLWTDFEELFGPNGACAGCWCMFWKLRGKAYDEARGLETRQMHKSIVDSGVATGLLAYLHGEVVGWIAVEPRESYPRLAHSRTLQPVDEQAVWSVTCFFVAKRFRRQGITVELLKAAVEHVLLGLDHLQVAEVLHPDGHRVDGRVELGVGEAAQGHHVLLQQDLPQRFGGGVGPHQYLRTFRMRLLWQGGVQGGGVVDIRPR